MKTLVITIEYNDDDSKMLICERIGEALEHVVSKEFRETPTAYQNCLCAFGWDAHVVEVEDEVDSDRTYAHFEIITKKIQDDYRKSLEQKHKIKFNAF